MAQVVNYATSAQEVYVESSTNSFEAATLTYLWSKKEHDTNSFEDPYKVQILLSLGLSGWWVDLSSMLWCTT